MIKNISNSKIIIENAVICRNFLSKFLGLMFSRKKNTALVFEFAKEYFISLHMFFVFYPIDVIFLDKNKIVVDLKENFKSFTLYTSKRKAMFAIEMPDGTIKKTKTGIGDIIEF